MTESEFLTLANTTLATIENTLEHATDTTDLDVECSRNGNVLEIECIDNGSKIIVNIQTPMQELWIAAKSGGFHYQYNGSQWLNTRDKSDFFDTLSRVITEQAGVAVKLG
jgi:CyaY protein